MTLFDACGRAVTGLSPGIYFVRSIDGERLRRLVVVR
jgi:hypothetical protein